MFLVNKSQHPVKPFLNKDKTIKVGEYFQKYIGKYVVYAKNVSDLKEVNSVKELSSSGLKYEKVVEELSENINRDDLNVTFNYELTNDNSWCKNDRRIKFSLSVITVAFTDVNGFTAHEFHRISFGTAHRKGIPCIWYKYSTSFTWNDYHLAGDVTIEGTTINRSFTAANQNINTSTFDRSGLIDGALPGQGGFGYDWTTTESRLTHQGMAGDWIEL